LAPTKPPEVLVGTPTTKEVAEFEEFTGRFEAFASVELRARVGGFLETINFKDGAIVKQGDLLFEIDARPYEALTEAAKANLHQAEAHAKRLGSDYTRAVSLQRRGEGSISPTEVDRIVGDKAEAEAAVETARASLRTAELNLGFTKVYAPINGRISRRRIDRGNLVKADDTILTTIVTLDPIYASFDVDERTLLTLRSLAESGAIPTQDETGVTVPIGLANEEGFSLSGVIDFEDNQVEPGTGTLRVRSVIANPKRILVPGLFFRVRLPVGPPHPAILVPEQAIGTDQGQKYLYVVNDKDEVVYKPVKTGLLDGASRVITSGLGPKERVIVSGLQRVRPGVKVAPKPFDPPKDTPPEPAKPSPKPEPVTPTVAGGGGAR
jgi:RND family efflux transporter MFP subunit